MNKSDLIEAIAAEMDCSIEAATRGFGAVFDKIKEALVNRVDVSIAGFGSFVTKERAARMGRNPKTGESLEIAASVVPSFKASKALKDSVNEANK